MSSLRWGILSTGNIARQFAEGLQASKTGVLHATASRDLSRAEAFAHQWGGKAHPDRDALFMDPEVDAVYIATPHHCHVDDVIAAAQAGKGILCEKPFALNLAETEEMLAAVAKANVFCMEAFMPRCTPQTAKVREWIDQIGTVLRVESEFAYPAKPPLSHQEKAFRWDPRVGGGALMDVGCYCVSFSRFAFGEEPIEVMFRSRPEPKTGVDWVGSGLLTFSGGRSATFGCGMGYQGKNDAVIFGETGRIEIDSPWKQRPGHKIRLYQGMDLKEELDLSLTNAELYAHEADAVAQFFEDKQCPWVSWTDTRGQMACLDRLKESAGL